MKIALVDTLHSNSRSVERALLQACEGRPLEVLRTEDPDELRSADKLVVPGQGGFGDCLRALRARGLDQAIVEEVRAGKPFLGICLGLQALFEASDEAPGVPGLALLPGRCERLLAQPGVKIPHMGWNSLKLTGEGHPALTAAGGSGSWFYFVHSFHAQPAAPRLLRACVTHGTQQVTAAIAQDNILATQFHPEKSQQVGLRLLSAFVSA